MPGAAAKLVKVTLKCVVRAYHADCSVQTGL